MNKVWVLTFKQGVDLEIEVFERLQLVKDSIATTWCNTTYKFKILDDTPDLYRVKIITDKGWTLYQAERKIVWNRADHF